MCEAYKEEYGCNFIALMPSNLYGINDNFDLNSSHFLPAMIRKFHEAKVSNAPHVELWGTGTPTRELLYVDDLAQAAVSVMENKEISDLTNIGTGKDLTIREFALEVKKVVGYQGEIKFDSLKPDGAPRKCCDVSKINSFGWKAKTSLSEGLNKTIQDFLKKKIV